MVGSGQGWTEIILLLDEHVNKFRIFLENEFEWCIVRKIGYCTDIHVGGGGNMVYANCKVEITLYCV
jgi:hypothetical protein